MVGLRRASLIECPQASERGSSASELQPRQMAKGKTTDRDGIRPHPARVRQFTLSGATRAIATKCESKVTNSVW